MAKNKEVAAWTANMRQYIINQLATFKSFKAVWADVTGEDFTKRTSMESLDPTIHHYDLFRMRCVRIKTQEIAIAHDNWVREMGEIRWAGDKERIQGLSDLIDTVNKYITDKDFDKDTMGTAAALVGQLRGLYEQVRKEVSADADRAALAASGTRVLLTNPKNVAIDAGYVSELLLMYRAEVGGLHNLDLAALNVSELELLRDKCTEIITERTVIDADFDVLDAETGDGDESG